MAQTLKEIYNYAFIERLAAAIKQEYDVFPSEHFISQVFGEHWEQLELKQRMRHITYCLTEALPNDFEQSLQILRNTVHLGTGLAYIIYPDFVEVNGLDTPELSLEALSFFTTYSTSEFAIRPFIEKYPELTFPTMLQWTKHTNEHVRRLASEGMRPRLPWAMQIRSLIEDPSPVIELISQLKQDESLYVRKSVANNINDIAKDHPEIVMQLARSWYGDNEKTNWIVRHGCRTLIKRGDAAALQLFGLGRAAAISISNFTATERVMLGEALYAQFTLHNSSHQEQRLRIEAEIHYCKASGKTSPKRFKISEKNFSPGSTEIVFKQVFKQLTTRKLYSGTHQLAVIVNGEQMAKTSFIVEL